MLYSVCEQCFIWGEFVVKVGVCCSFVLEDGFNMSYFSYFVYYIGGVGGSDGLFNVVDVKGMVIVLLGVFVDKGNV